jgi:hypothetical protein
MQRIIRPLFGACFALRPTDGQPGESAMPAYDGQHLGLHNVRNKLIGHEIVSG